MDLHNATSLFDFKILIFNYKLIVVSSTYSFFMMAGILASTGCNQRTETTSSPSTHTASETIQSEINQPQTLSMAAKVGQRLFFDPTLSASGKMSCASCHNPNHAFAPDNNLAVQLGGSDLKRQGARATPSLAYVMETPIFSMVPDDDGDAEFDQTANISANQNIQQKTGMPKVVATVPKGGFFLDGRANTLPEQALGPLLNPVEMNNESENQVVEKLKRLSYLNDLKAINSSSVQSGDKLLLSKALFAIARYETEEKAFALYNSKYDQYLQGKVTLNPAEMRGLKLFDDPKKGNCAACHLDKKTVDGRPPSFTDYQFAALGVPRNLDLSANANPQYFDLGICGPSRQDIYSKQAKNCGLFKTPSLRNVATKHVFFHNGAFHNLEDVLHFYVERDIQPEKFYPKKTNGGINKFNDLPEKYKVNINVEAPLNRKIGDRPALNDAEIKDVISFLNTLTDGYISSKPPLTSSARRALSVF